MYIYLQDTYLYISLRDKYMDTYLRETYLYMSLYYVLQSTCNLYIASRRANCSRRSSRRTETQRTYWLCSIYTWTRRVVSSLWQPLSSSFCSVSARRNQAEKYRWVALTSADDQWEEQAGMWVHACQPVWQRLLECKSFCTLRSHGLAPLPSLQLRFCHIWTQLSEI